MNRVPASLAAALTYLGLALWQMRAVLRAPAENAAFSNAFYEIGAGYGFHDLKMVVSQIAYNARTFLDDPVSLLVGPQCYPMQWASTFGEHMLAEGLLGVLPYAVSGDPLITMAAVLTAKPVIAALAAYALVLRWTERPAAAFVAGLFFGFHPLRLIDPAHIFLSSHEWTVLALLALDAILIGGGWSWVGLFVLAAGLQVLESFYPLVGFTLLVGIFGLWKLALDPGDLRRSVPKLVVCAAALGLLAATVFIPYLQTREAWSVLANREIYVLYPLAKYLPGDFLFLGFVFLVLGLIGLIDFLIWPRPDWRADPRGPLLLGGLALAWFGIRDLQVPFVEWPIPALYHFLRWVPGVDAVRAPAVISYSGLVAATVFAGYGMRRLLQGRGILAGRVFTAVVAFLYVVEVFVPGVSTRVFGHRFDAAAVELRPPEDVLLLHEQLPAGPVLNLPWLRGKSGEYLLLNAYHHRRIGACYNSFESPLAAQLRSLADRLPDPAALEAVSALGFRSLVVHDDAPMTPETRARLAGFGEVVRGSEGASVAVLSGRAGGHRAYVIEEKVPPRVDLASLAFVPRGVVEISTAAPSPIPFEFRNVGAGVYRQPIPIEPRAVVVRWRSSSGAVPFEERARALLPVVLMPGERATVEVAASPPAPGLYDVTLLLADAPERALATQRVRVEAPGSNGT